MTNVSSVESFELIIYIIIFHYFRFREAECESDEFQCDSGYECLDYTFVCDNEKLCLDGSDELCGKPLYVPSHCWRTFDVLHPMPYSHYMSLVWGAHFITQYSTCTTVFASFSYAETL